MCRHRSVVGETEKERGKHVMRDADGQTDTDARRILKKKKKTYVGWTRRGGRTRQAEPQSMDGGGIVSISSNVDKVRRGRREGEKVNEVSKRTRE